MSRIGAFAIASIAALVGCGDASTSPDIDPGPPSGDPVGSGTVVVDDIVYETALQVMESFPVQIAADVVITNGGDSTARITFADGCVALLRAFHPLADGPVWDQGQEVACTQATVPVELGPGESRSFRTPTASAREVLGGDLPDGTYQFSVYLRPVGETIEIDSGSVELAIPR